MDICRMQLIDSHAHLYLKDFDEDFGEMISRAEDEGVEKIVLPNIDSSTIDRLNNTVQKNPSLFAPAMGLHPTSVKENYKTELDEIMAELKKGSYVGIGEIGIDLYWDQTYVDQQIEAFEAQVVLAKEMGLPIIIHCRDSFDEIFTVVDRQNDDRLKGIFHCFTGTVHRARHIIEYGGFKIGIGGVVTFKNSNLDKTLEEVPLEHIVLETDSPYLTPVPFRGRRNETSYINYVAKKLADVYARPLEEIGKVTSDNCREIFDL